MRSAVLKLQKAIADYQDVHDELTKCHEVIKSAAAEVKGHGAGSYGSSFSGGLGIIYKGLDIHKGLVDASDKCCKFFKSGVASMAQVASNSNSGPAANNSTGHRDLSSPGEVTEGLKAEHVSDLMKQCSRSGVLDMNAFTKALAESTIMTTPLAKQVQHLVGRRNPNEANPHFGNSGVPIESVDGFKR